MITKEYLENSPRDRRVNLEKWLKVNGEISDLSVSEKKRKGCRPGDLQDGGRKQREMSVFACPREVGDESSAGRWADMSRWTMGYRTWTLKATPN